MVPWVSTFAGKTRGYFAHLNLDPDFSHTLSREWRLPTVNASRILASFWPAFQNGLPLAEIGQGG